MDGGAFPNTLEYTEATKNGCSKDEGLRSVWWVTLPDRLGCKVSDAERDSECGVQGAGMQGAGCRCALHAVQGAGCQ